MMIDNELIVYKYNFIYLNDKDLINYDLKLNSIMTNISDFNLDKYNLNCKFIYTSDAYASIAFSKNKKPSIELYHLYPTLIDAPLNGKFINTNFEIIIDDLKYLPDFHIISNYISINTPGRIIDFKKYKLDVEFVVIEGGIIKDFSGISSSTKKIYIKNTKIDNFEYLRDDINVVIIDSHIKNPLKYIPKNRIHLSRCTSDNKRDIEYFLKNNN